MIKASFRLTSIHHTSILFTRWHRKNHKNCTVCFITSHIFCFFFFHSNCPLHEKYIQRNCKDIIVPGFSPWHDHVQSSRIFRIQGKTEGRYRNKELIAPIKTNREMADSNPNLSIIT